LAPNELNAPAVSEAAGFAGAVTAGAGAVAGQSAEAAGGVPDFSVSDMCVLVWMRPAQEPNLSAEAG
jgi:hypothetical protein